MRILVVGDSFVPARVFEQAFAGLAGDHDIEYVQLDEDPPLVPRTRSERSIREFIGTPAQVTTAMSGVEVLIVHGAPVTDSVLDASPLLRLIGCARGGPLNVDLAAARQRGLPVVTTPGKNAEAVADQTIAFLIMLARRFPYAQRFLADGGTLGESAFEGAQFLGDELGGRVLGLVGFGKVGRSVARRAAGFGMTILVHDPYVDRGPEGTDGVEHVDSLPDLLERAHFVSLHARVTPENENLFDRDAFAAMRRGGYFVNTARETLVDESALDEALASGHLGGAALDVVRPSHADGPHRLLRHDNVIITPHIGGATHETLLRGAAMLADEVARFAAGKPQRNLINGAVVAHE